MNIPSYIASNALNGLAQSLAESWDGAWRSIEILPRIEHTMYSISATVQTLVPTPDAMKSNACERVLARRRSRCEDTYLIQSALVKNDWILIDYLLQNEPSSVTNALSSAGAEARIPWILHRAASSNAGNAMQSIAHLADVDVIDERGNTPLHIAAMCGNITAVKKLIEAGADPTARNHNGDTPLDLCVSLSRTFVRCASLIAIHLPVKLRDEYRTRWWYLSAPETLRQLLYDPRQFESGNAQ
ncbi:MAG: ankyrin repeat domain-containing protein [Ignavibacteria bacterium]|nr:ankyrin repeat domain-containing protein [Ignavibacteria bacterium]